MRAALHDRVENLDLYCLSSEVATKNECATSVGFASARRDADADDAPVGGAPLPNPAAEPAAGAGVAIAVNAGAAVPHAVVIERIDGRDPDSKLGSLFSEVIRRCRALRN